MELKSKKTYKPQIYRIILNIIYSILGTILLFYILTYFIDNIYIISLIPFLFLVFYFKLVIYNNFITIYIDDNMFKYKKGNKIKCYDINKCQFGARIVNSTGDSECELNIVDEDNKTDYIDCELIGYRQFNNLLNDLKVIGKESKPIKIKTIEKGDGN